MYKKLCITGGPCAGKTTALAYITEKLSDRGFHPLTVPEAATLLMQSRLLPTHTSPAFFQTQIIRIICSLEKTFEAMARRYPHLNPVIICDRGVADSAAYVSRDDYIKALRANRIPSPVKARDLRYSAVFHLMSAANGAEEFYTVANNATRTETVSRARELDQQTIDAWMGHPHLRIIDNSTDFSGKLQRLDREICSALGVPTPLEVERKFLCRSIDRSLLPPNSQVLDIEQIYLRSKDDIVKRIRRRGQKGSYVYFQTEKRAHSYGTSSETEHFISEKKYRERSRKIATGTRPLSKTRTCFTYQNQYFELDEIKVRDGRVLHLLEIELTDMQQEVALPPFITIEKEVTGDPDFSNRALACL